MGIKLPELERITVDVKKTALIVLDGSQSWSDPEQPPGSLSLFGGYSAPLE